MKYYIIYFLSLLIISINSTSCSLKKDIEINLPPHNSQIYVESYLIPGAVYGVSLAETVGYLDSLKTPKLSDATVVITYKGKSDTLFETTEGIYISNDTVPADYTQYFELYVKDNKGRIVTSRTKIQPPVPIDSIRYIFNKNNKAATIVYFADPDKEENFYNIFLLYADREFFNDYEFNGKSKPFISSYNMKEKDTLDIKLLNISKECYEFIKSVSYANLSNVRPLTEPTPIKSNITGGVGIFTGLSYTQKRVVVTK